MSINRIVLDTNCLIAILSRKGNYFSVWQGLHQGKYILCVNPKEISKMTGQKKENLTKLRETGYDCTVSACDGLPKYGVEIRKG